ncbi:AMP-binding protein [Fuscibacter oryzae]|uniref:AMP-binding protein n=1 Tax=Fuscibacter oryzae TaxID=2803939 RepID=A0A8J7SWB2_9RHOB|nr:AMP-binding protein [Fuscibacter oryzae]MBL4928734.1 AMP-binding protein [Fuscibacter oryzae]
MKARFRLHPAARLFDGVGEVVVFPVAGAAVLADRPGAAALIGAFGRGCGFRIGGDGEPATEGFETLTSGSSGKPRRIWRSVESWAASFAVNAGLFGIGPGCRVAVLGRLSHSLALYGALEGLSLGAEVHLLDGIRPDRQRQEMAARGVEVVYATPAQLRLLIEAGGAGLPSLRLVLVGGSKLDAVLRRALAAMAPAAAVREFYGAAEASFITLAGEATPIASVGAAYPGVEIAVRSAGGDDVPECTLGEVWVRSAYLFHGYAGDDPGSARCCDGWLSVGEMGYLAGGELYLAGRAGRMVTVADQNVFPEEIEASLAGLTGVARVAVVPVADGLRGHVLVAVCQGDAAQEAAILRAARAELGPLKAPKILIWRQDWPELSSGKTDLAAIARGLSWR